MVSVANFCETGAMVAQEEQDVVEGLMVTERPKQLRFALLARELGPAIPHRLVVGRDEIRESFSQAGQVYRLALQHCQGGEDGSVGAEGLLGDCDLAVLTLFGTGTFEVQPDCLAGSFQAHGIGLAVERQRFW
jgi:hypothetical protein